MRINNIYLNKYNQSFEIAHQIDSIPDMKRIIQMNNPKLIIDLGTYNGGTAAVFHDACPDSIIHTYDNLNRKKIIIKIDNPNIHYHIEDVLKPSDELLSFIKSKDKKFLYCDNGNKPKEMNLFVPYLNSGDLIGVHDFGTEIKELDLSKILPDLIPIDETLFEMNKWLTRFWIKK